MLPGWRIGLDASTETCPVDWVSGACVLARFSCLRTLGGFDPRFFLYWEEVEPDAPRGAQRMVLPSCAGRRGFSQGGSGTGLASHRPHAAGVSGLLLRQLAPLLRKRPMGGSIPLPLRRSGWRQLDPSCAFRLAAQNADKHAGSRNAVRPPPRDPTASRGIQGSRRKIPVVVKRVHQAVTMWTHPLPPVERERAGLARTAEMQNANVLEGKSSPGSVKNGVWKLSAKLVWGRRPFARCQRDSRL